MVCSIISPITIQKKVNYNKKIIRQCEKHLKLANVQMYITNAIFARSQMRETAKMIVVSYSICVLHLKTDVQQYKCTNKIF